MEKQGNDLFQIGEVAKILGVTRRILINYEDLGLVTPAVRNEGRGFRFYSADNIVHIKIIRTLQNLGLSLPEIKKYFSNTVHLDEQIDRLVFMRNQLDSYISQLRLRQSKSEDAEIQLITLSEITAYCKDFKDVDLATKTSELRDTYVEALRRHYKLDVSNKMCIHQNGFLAPVCGTYVVPVLPESCGENIRHFPQTQAISIFYRGPYEDFPDVYSRLFAYAKENGMTPSGYLRNDFIEGPPTHGANKSAYMTQVSLQVKFDKAEENSN